MINCVTDKKLGQSSQIYMEMLENFAGTCTGGRKRRVRHLIQERDN